MMASGGRVRNAVAHRNNGLAGPNEPRPGKRRIVHSSSAEDEGGLRIHVPLASFARPRPGAPKGCPATALREKAPFRTKRRNTRSPRYDCGSAPPRRNPAGPFSSSSCTRLKHLRPPFPLCTGGLAAPVWAGRSWLPCRSSCWSRRRSCVSCSSHEVRPLPTRPMSRSPPIPSRASPTSWRGSSWWRPCPCRRARASGRAGLRCIAGQGGSSWCAGSASSGPERG